jgi:hypothetical protein
MVIDLYKARYNGIIVIVIVVEIDMSYRKPEGS